MKNSKWSKVCFGIVGALLGAGVVLAQDSVGLNIFQAGQVISASEVNENFALLDQKIAANTQAITLLASLDAQQVERILKLVEKLGPDQVTQIFNNINQNNVDINLINQSLTQINTNLTLVQEQINSDH